MIFPLSRLTVVDTPGFGDAINNTDSFKEIIKYIDLQFDRWEITISPSG